MEPSAPELDDFVEDPQMESFSDINFNQRNHFFQDKKSK
jgi:hypothetical protein